MQAQIYDLHLTVYLLLIKPKLLTLPSVRNTLKHINKEINMKDKLLDIITHTNQLGFIDLIKITGSKSETQINATADDRTVIVQGKFKNPDPNFIGTFGMPQLGKLRTILSFDDYDENAVINMIYKENNDKESLPEAIHFETADGSFVNDYRLMSKAIVEEKVKAVKFAGATWNIDFEPQVANILRLKKQSQANSEESVFTTKMDNTDLRVYFGDVSSHSGNFVFESNLSGTLQHAWSWPVKQFLSIMDLTGDKHVYISDQGAMRITVDSGLIEYEYLLPAQTK